MNSSFCTFIIGFLESIFMKILVVYYSRTGRTRKLAQEIHQKIESEINEIHDRKTRKGILGWLSAGRDAGQRKETEIKGDISPPSSFDIIVIGSPTWNGGLSVPILTYVNRYLDDLKHVAVFTTGDGEDLDAIEELRNILGKKVFSMSHFVREKEIDTMSYNEKLTKFITQIKSFAR